MNKYANHQDNLNRTTLYLQKVFPMARFFDQHVGKFLSVRIIEAIKKFYSLEQIKQWLATKSYFKYLISINKPGMSDQYAIIPILINGKKIPVFIPIETKTGTGKLSPDQKKWKKIYEMLGCKYIVSRDKKEVEKEINEYIEWLKSDV
jgi:hypothetical protein